eukprot:9281133-Alexandrium_andersonii.AAC.1
MHEAGQAQHAVIDQGGRAATICASYGTAHRANAWRGPYGKPWAGQLLRGYKQDGTIGWRFLSPREAARIQGLPENAPLGTPLDDSWHYIGNALPVVMALEWIATIVILVTRTPAGVRPAAQRALHAACMDARPVEGRCEFPGR